MREVRRQDRLLSESESRRLLEMGEYGFLAMVNIDGGGYGLPVSCDKCVRFFTIRKPRCAHGDPAGRLW